MTTLPQTTPLRIPRPGSQVLAIPGGPSVLGIPQQPLSGLSGGDVVRVLRANVWLILLLLIVGSVAGYGVNLWLAATHARYTATAYIRVMTNGDIPHPGDFMPPEGNVANIEIEAREQVTRIRQPSLITRVLTNSAAIRETRWFQQFVSHEGGSEAVKVDAAKRDLLEKLEVGPVLGTRLLAVSFSCSIPKDCQTVVKEVVDQHIRDERQSFQDSESDTSRSLARVKLQYEGDLSETQGRIARIMHELSDGGQPVNGTGSHDIELQSLTSAQIRAQESLLDAEDRLSRFRQALTQPGTPPEIEQAIRQDTKYSQTQAELDQDSIQLEQANGALLDANPEVVRLKSRAELLKKRLETLHAQLQKQMTAQFQIALAQAVVSAKSSVEAINTRITAVQASIAGLAGRRNEFERLRTEEQVLVEKLAKLKDQAESLSNYNVNGEFAKVAWATQPDVPDMPTFPKLASTMTMAIGLSLALSLGIAFLRELTDTTVRSPRDIARVGQMNLLGMIPHQNDDPQSSGGRLPLVVFEAPHSMLAEQFRQVRTRLQHAASLDTTRSILVTGCSPGDGKTTVACNLAAGLALNGRRILLVDANFRRPQLHQIFNLENKLGFGDLLSSAHEFNEAVRETSVPNLSVLVLGNRPPNPTELLESQLLIDFIERALEEYDHVIFDSGPLLIVSETIGLAPRVDGVITVVRALGDSRGILARMRDQLRQLKAEHLGVILNAVRVHGGGYYGPLMKTYYAYNGQES